MLKKKWVNVSTEVGALHYILIRYVLDFKNVSGVREWWLKVEAFDSTRESM